MKVCINKSEVNGEFSVVHNGNGALKCKEATGALCYNPETGGLVYDCDQILADGFSSEEDAKNWIRDKGHELIEDE